MSYDTEIPNGDYDVDTVANPTHDVDTPSGTRYVAPETLTNADKVSIILAGIVCVVAYVGGFMLMALY